jgi:hypothetical protein
MRQPAVTASCGVLDAVFGKFEEGEGEDVRQLPEERSFCFGIARLGVAGETSGWPASWPLRC